MFRMAVLIVAVVTCLGLAVATVLSQANRSPSQDPAAINADVIRLFQAGQYAEAIPLAEQLVEVVGRSLGRDHPDIAPLLNNLAALYDAAGRHSLSEAILKRSIAIGEKAYGPEHEDLVPALYNLAQHYKTTGRLREAEPLYQRSIRIFERSKGRAHPDVSQPLESLATLYIDQRRLADAEPLIQRALAIFEGRRLAEDARLASVLEQLGKLRMAQGRWDDAEVALKQSVEMRRRTQGLEHPAIGTTLAFLGNLQMLQSRYGDAERTLKDALSLYERTLGPMHASVGGVHTTFGMLFARQSRAKQAQQAFERALAVYEAALGPGHPYIAMVLSKLAEQHRDQEEFGRAEALLTRSLEIREATLGPEHPDFATDLTRLSNLYRVQGLHVDAEPLALRALAILENAYPGGHHDVTFALDNLAGIYKDTQRYAEAERIYEKVEGISLAVFGPDHPDLVTVLNNSASLWLERGDWRRAADVWRRSADILKRRAARSAGASPAPSRDEAQNHGWIFESLVKAAYRSDAGGSSDVALIGEMFENAQWGQASEAAVSLAQMAARSASNSPALAVLIRERQDLIAEWVAGDRLLTSARSEPPERRDMSAESAQSSRLSAIDTRLAEIDRELARDFPSYATLADPKPASISDVQASLDDHEALVLFLDTPDNWAPTLPEETFVWIVTKTAARWMRSELGTAALRREVAALRCGLDVASWWAEASACPALTGASYSWEDFKAGKAPPFDIGRAHALYSALFAGTRQLLAGKHLLVVPSGALTALPFQILVTEPPTASPSSQTAWLIRDHAITTMPSVAALASLRRTAKPSAASKAWIGFGNPLLDGDQADPDHGTRFKALAERARLVTGCAADTSQKSPAMRASRRGAQAVLGDAGLADQAHLKLQQPLPETADELCEVARSLGAAQATLRLGASATEAEVKKLSGTKDLATYRIIHFATHGMLAGQLGGTREPGLVLSPPVTATAHDDGYLAASEIAGLKLDADWVILSACNTAGGAGEGDAGVALSGLARAFFYAGSRALLVTHWEVDSDAAVKLVTGVVAALTQETGIGRAEALRRAMLALMTGGQRPQGWMPAAHPAVWAPFVVVGEGGAGR